MKEESYGVIKQHQNIDTSDKHLEELSILGYSIIEGVLNATELAETRKRLDAVYDLQVQEAVRNNYNLAEIKEQNVARMPFAYDNYFINLLIQPLMIEYVKKVLGNYFILQLQNGIINLPNEKHHQSSWHRDLPYQDFVISKPLAVNVLYCIDEYTLETGATFVLPFSHRVESIPSEEYVKKHGIQVVAPAGSVILMDSMVFHRAGYNSSTIIRRAINQVYVSGIIKQQINIPAMLDGKFADDPFLKMLLGYQAAEANNVNEYRMRRVKKIS